MKRVNTEFSRQKQKVCKDQEGRRFWKLNVGLVLDESRDGEESRTMDSVLREGVAYPLHVDIWGRELSCQPFHYWNLDIARHPPSLGGTKLSLLESY